MKTGSQIEKINQFSITSFFWRLLDSVRLPGAACKAFAAAGICLTAYTCFVSPASLHHALLSINLC